MINSTNGQVTIGKLVLAPGTTRMQFINSASFGSGRAINPAEGWYLASAKRQHAGANEFAVNLLFDGERLESVDIVNADPAFGRDWAEWSEKGQLERKAAHDALLEADLGNRREFGWGRVDSVFDQKGGGSFIVIKYTP
jgi:hypothetical protein